MVWLNFLHLYQPIHADPYVVEEATEKCYKELVKILEDHPNLNFTFNITGCLILRWRELGYTALIKRVKDLVKSGQIELVGSAAYHPLLPLIPEKEAESQIKENTKILHDNFGKDISLKGFFFPEMAYSPRVANLVGKMGFEWVILDELAYSGNLSKLPRAGGIYIDAHSGLRVIFRSRKLSNDYVPRVINKEIKEGNRRKVSVTATDGELYGLRHQDKENELENMAGNKKITTDIISHYIESAKINGKRKMISCSWESSPQELKQKEPY
ncbi:MAG TPA: polysaccharide deacetylase family protein, partial [Patescibacteria group bacterium]|nr:polysaccharide deacetylase family protein [Patescibacteria group bacterium]